MDEFGEQLRSPSPASASGQDEYSPSSNNTSNCTTCMQAARNHLQVCLKLLGLFHRSHKATNPSQNYELYLAVVMLNASLLKGLHVADSFHMHCAREFQSAIARAEEEEEEAEVIFERELLLEDSPNDVPVSSRGYRRLQAECVVLGEAAYSLEQDIASDQAQIAKLEEECRKLRECLARGLQPPSPPRLTPTPEPSAEVQELQSMGVRVEPTEGGGAFIPELHLKGLALEIEGLNQELSKARAAAQVRSARCRKRRRKKPRGNARMSCACYCLPPRVGQWML